MQKIKSEKIGKFLAVLFLASVPIILWSMFFGDKDNDKLLCDSRGGEMQNHGICVIKTNDYKKACRDNEDCKGECLIKNWEELLEKWVVSFGKETPKVGLKEFEEKTGERVEGFCSEFTFNKEHCLQLSPIYIEKGIMHKNINPGQIPSWGCRNLPE